MSLITNADWCLLIMFILFYREFWYALPNLPDDQRSMFSLIISVQYAQLYTHLFLTNI